MMHRQATEGVIARSRARWCETGEKSTAYFLGLEKRNYTNKFIPSLCIGSERISKQSEMILSLEEHYREVFREQPVNEDELELFFENLKVKQLSKQQKMNVSKPLDLRVLSLALMKMKSNKAPGSDGFPSEFFNFFWNDLKFLYFRMVIDSLAKGKLPLSLREGILTLLPKPNKAERVDIHVCYFNNELCFTTKVPLQVASAPCMMHPTTNRHHRNTPATAFELRSVNCNSVADLASLAKGTAILTHRIDQSHRLVPFPFRSNQPFGRYSLNGLK